MPPSDPLAEILRAVPRRYRLPVLDAPDAVSGAWGPTRAIVMAIESVRQARGQGTLSAPQAREGFIDALAALIAEALRADPAFQALVLRHRLPRVREYAALTAHARADCRSVRMMIDAIAHPAKRRRLRPGPRRDALARLHDCAAGGQWERARAVAQDIAAMSWAEDAALTPRGVVRLLASAALDNLCRLDELASDAGVRDYLALEARNGPRSGSAQAIAQGAVARRRGEAVEAATASVLWALARRLQELEGGRSLYRVVTSMRVPASIPASHERAKTEWDAVLLRHAGVDGGTAVWDVRLLAEAKASADAAASDLPRLQRGVRLLAHAVPGAVYVFETREGEVRLRGASLSALREDPDSLARQVLYCCDTDAEPATRLLGAAGRMQLLSAPASLAYASVLQASGQAVREDLAPVWRQLTQSARWDAVLDQYATLRQARALLVRLGDLAETIAMAG